MRKRRAAAAVLGLVLAGQAQAEWREARSKHFIVYSESREADLRETATRLEQLDALARLLARNTTAEADQIANPLTVYVVDDMAAVRRIYGGGAGNIGGFYLPRATGSIAFVPRVVDDLEATGQLVLLHEYAHHFLLGNSNAAYPAWFSEGYAEFMATTRFTATGLDFGRPAQHRAQTLFGHNAMTAERLLTYGQKRLTGEEVQALYARGWLLTHYIIFDPERGRQFSDYMRRLAVGEPNAQAARAAFGDLGKLSAALNAYLRRNRFAVRTIARDKLPVPATAVRALPQGQAAMLPFRIRSTRGVDDKAAKSLYAQAARVAAAWPADPVVQGWYAEMAFDAKEDAAAETAADRALAADPRSVQALLYKAHVRLRRATANKGDEAAWKEARSWIVRANRIDNNDAGALSLYYQSFLMADAAPSKPAIAGLQRASVLVPQDPSLRWMLARQYILDGNADAARDELRPLAYDPHAAPDNAAARLIALLDGGAKGQAALDALGKDAAPAR